ncbi:MAG: glycosyltransferase [Thermodesulfobacteriota bacterium]|nr:glycosyltransferase [Thermodesulfobacteriota bacterium]
MEPFSIIIPVFNEEEIIIQNTKKLVDYLNQLDTPYEIIIGSNGSTDKTVSLGKMMEEEFKQITFFHLFQRGVGKAFKKGILLARFERIISLDMDLSTELSFIKDSLRLLYEYDIIIGSKKMGTQKRKLIRKLGSDGFILCSKVLLGLNYKDYSIGAKAYKKSVILEYLNRVNSGTSYVIEIVYYAKRDGFKIIESPVLCVDFRKSKFNLIHEGYYRFSHLFKLYIRGHLFRSLEQPLIKEQW